MNQAWEADDGLTTHPMKPQEGPKFLDRTPGSKIKKTLCLLFLFVFSVSGGDYVILLPALMKGKDECFSETQKTKTKSNTKREVS